MSIMRFPPAAWLASGAVLALTVSPAMAQPGPYWHRHRHHGNGDFVAGLLIAGGIAAVAVAASSAKTARATPVADDPPLYTAPQIAEPAYPGGPIAGQDEPEDYTPPDGDDRFAPAAPYPGPPRQGYVNAGRAVESSVQSPGELGFDGAVDSCVAELSRDGVRLGRVDNVGRAGNGYHVEGRIADGRDFSCAMDGDGRIRAASIDGRAVL